MTVSSLFAFLIDTLIYPIQVRKKSMQEIYPPTDFLQSNKDLRKGCFAKWMYSKFHIAAILGRHFHSFLISVVCHRLLRNALMRHFSQIKMEHKCLKMTSGMWLNFYGAPLPPKY